MSVNPFVSKLQSFGMLPRAMTTHSCNQPEDRTNEQDPDGPSDVGRLKHAPEKGENGELGKRKRKGVENLAEIEQQVAVIQYFFLGQMRDVLLVPTETLVRPCLKNEESVIAPKLDSDRTWNIYIAGQQSSIRGQRPAASPVSTFAARAFKTDKISVELTHAPMTYQSSHQILTLVIRRATNRKTREIVAAASVATTDA